MSESSEYIMRQLESVNPPCSVELFCDVVKVFAKVFPEDKYNSLDISEMALIQKCIGIIQLTLRNGDIWRC